MAIIACVWRTIRSKETGGFEDSSCERRLAHGRSGIIRCAFMVFLRFRACHRTISGESVRTLCPAEAFHSMVQAMPSVRRPFASSSTPVLELLEGLFSRFSSIFVLVTAQLPPNGHHRLGLPHRLTHSSSRLRGPDV